MVVTSAKHHLMCVVLDHILNGSTFANSTFVFVSRTQYTTTTLLCQLGQE